VSKFDDVVKILNEYDVRHSSQGIPSVPGDGYTATGDPNIVGNSAQFAPFRGKQPAIIKPFVDELNHFDNSTILPYPLDHVIERLVILQTTIMEIKSLLKTSYSTADLNKPQRHMISEYYNKLDIQLKDIKKFISDLDSMSIPY
jgi:predicted oxidoreductase